MRVLALETATTICSVALLALDAVIERSAPLGRGHEECILAMVEAVLAEAGVTLGELDGIAASIGPGSFTGVRTSVAVAQGLAFGSGLPVAAVSTLEALALQVLHEGAHPRGARHALACLDARMGEVYWGCFASDGAHGLIHCSASAVGAPARVRLAGAGPYRGIGQGFAAYPVLAALPGLQLDPAAAQALPRAREVAHLGAIRLAAGLGVDAARLSPLYLRDQVALTTAERRQML